jgi:hypothetical protein
MIVNKQDNTTMNIKLLKSILHAYKDVLKNKAKSRLHVVHVEGGVASLTDGHKATQFEWDVPDGHYPIDKLLTAIKAAEVAKQELIAEPDEQLRDFPYPSMDQIFEGEGEDPECIHLVLDAKYLAQLCAISSQCPDDSKIYLIVPKPLADEDTGMRQVIKPVVMYHHRSQVQPPIRSLLMPATILKHAIPDTLKAIQRITSALSR